MDTVDKILALLKDSGMNDQDFIKKLDSKNKDLVLCWKNGTAKSYLKYIPQIAEIFNVSTDYLFGVNTTNTFPEDIEQLFSLYHCLKPEDKEQVIRYVRLLAQDNKSE